MVTFRVYRVRIDDYGQVTVLGYNPEASVGLMKLHGYLIPCFPSPFTNYYCPTWRSETLVGTTLRVL
jgi:hypothetical protein